LDISQGLLDIAKINIDSSCSIDSEIIQSDFNFDDLQKTFGQIKLDTKLPSLIFFVNGTLSNNYNQSALLTKIRYGMLCDDRLVISDAFDSLDVRSKFLAYENPKYREQLHRIPKLLGIDSDKIEKESTEKKGRRISIILDKNYTLYFWKENIKVNLKKGQKINIWKHKADNHKFINEKLESNRFALIVDHHYSNLNQIVYMCKIA
jgi:hypothetical protein